MRALAALFFLALVLRLIGIDFGLPALLHPDEPHHINLAVYFGSGDFNPHVFKYPTLWMYLLFLLYCVYFAVWSGFGFWHSAKEFAHLFIWDPSGFYLIGRATAAVCGALAVIPVYFAAKKLANGKEGEGHALLGAAFMAIGPVLVYDSHFAKPDMLMLALISLYWLACAGIYAGGTSWKNYALAGASLGLAGSSQYTAVLAAPLAACAHLTRAHSGVHIKTLLRDPKIWTAYLICALAFFIGTPYALVERSKFIQDISDVLHNQQGLTTGQPERAGFCIAANLLEVTGWPVPAAVLITLAGIFFWIRRHPRAFFFLAIPIGVAAAFLASLSTNACAARYVNSVLPGFAILAGGLAMGLPDRMARLRPLLWALLLAPALYKSAMRIRPFLQPDTRILAQQWIEQNIAEKNVFLMDQVFSCPQLVMDAGQVAQLLKETSAIQHPRARYYELMLESHPGGGYVIYRLLRTAAELDSMRRHVEWSQKGYALLDAEPGLKFLRLKGIKYVITSSSGANPINSPRLKKFFWELENQAVLLREFRPDDNVTGPIIKIYQI